MSMLYAKYSRDGSDMKAGDPTRIGDGETGTDGKDSLSLAKPVRPNGAQEQGFFF
jgi:hypothetical protein